MSKEYEKRLFRQSTSPNKWVLFRRQTLIYFLNDKGINILLYKYIFPLAYLPIYDCLYCQDISTSMAFQNFTRKPMANPRVEPNQLPTAPLHFGVVFHIVDFLTLKIHCLEIKKIKSNKIMVNSQANTIQIKNTTNRISKIPIK